MFPASDRPACAPDRTTVTAGKWSPEQPVVASVARGFSLQHREMRIRQQIINLPSFGSSREPMKSADLQCPWMQDTKRLPPPNRADWHSALSTSTANVHRDHRQRAFGAPTWGRVALPELRSSGRRCRGAA